MMIKVVGGRRASRIWRVAVDATRNIAKCQIGRFEAIQEMRTINWTCRGLQTRVDQSAKSSPSSSLEPSMFVAQNCSYNSLSYTRVSSSSVIRAALYVPPALFPRLLASAILLAELNAELHPRR